MVSFPVQQPYRILIAGGAYGGVSAAVNLLDLSLGRSARLDPDKAPVEEARDGVPIEIHIVDERDGYCEIESRNTYTLSSSNHLYQTTPLARLLPFHHQATQQKHGGSLTTLLLYNTLACASHKEASQTLTQINE
jgi:hypothetical protein